MTSWCVHMIKSGFDKEYLDFPVAQTPVVKSVQNVYSDRNILVTRSCVNWGLDHRPKKKIEPGGNILLRMEASLKPFGTKPRLQRRNGGHKVGSKK